MTDGVLWRRDREMHRTIIATGSERNVAWVGTVGAGQPVFAFQEYSFDSSYATGGESVASLVPTRVGLLMASKLQYTPSYSSSSDTVLVYDSTTGSEVANATDLEAAGLTSLPTVHVGTEGNRVVYYAGDDVYLARILVGVTSAFTRDTTNYWSLTPLIVDEEGNTEEIADAYTLDTVNLSARRPIAIFTATDTIGLEVPAGYTIELELAQTGTPQPLVGLFAIIDVQRRLH